MSRRKQHVPWTAAGTASEQQHSADDVVRRTGWVFNNRTGQELDLAAFVETGDHETLAYLQAFGHVVVAWLWLDVALAAGLALPLLQWLGYTPGRTDDTSLRALSLSYCLLPCALKLVAAALLQVEFGMKSSVKDVTPILSGVNAGYSCVFG